MDDPLISFRGDVLLLSCQSCNVRGEALDRNSMEVRVMNVPAEARDWCVFMCCSRCSSQWGVCLTCSIGSQLVKFTKRIHYQLHSDRLHCQEEEPMDESFIVANDEEEDDDDDDAAMNMSTYMLEEYSRVTTSLGIVDAYAPDFDLLSDMMHQAVCPS